MSHIIDQHCVYKYPIFTDIAFIHVHSFLTNYSFVFSPVISPLLPPTLSSLCNLYLMDYNSDRINNAEISLVAVGQISTSNYIWGRGLSVYVLPELRPIYRES